ncbi:MAG: LamG-like jellyroll fold domain-containing protein, partial [Bacteroidota bacterium]
MKQKLLCLVLLIMMQLSLFAQTITISSFSPAIGSVGTLITINGTNFTGATAVSIGGTAAASFTVLNSNIITAVVGSGTMGVISVSTPGGSATSSGSFTYLFPNTGNALALNGSSQYVSVADNNALNLTNNFTVEAWIKPNSFTALGGIVTKYNSASSNGFTFTLGGTSPYTSISFCGQTTANDLLSAGKWYHVAGVVKAGQVTIYINGVSVKTGTAATLAANSDAMTIGRDYTPSPRYFNGVFDEVRIWNDVRTQAEIQANMFSELTPATGDNLVAYYKCNESTGSTTLTDIKSGLNGTLSASPIFPYSYAWMGGTYTVNPAGTGHDNFTTFASSVTVLNATNLISPVIFNMKDDATYTETANQTITTTGTVSKTITFQRSNDGTNKPKLQFTGTNGTTDACIQLNSSDYMTFNGLEIQPNGTSGSNFVEYGIFLNAAGATDGCQYNTIKNCDIKFGGGGTTNTASTTGIYLDNIATSAAGANSYNLFYSNKIDKATHGYLLLGTIGYNDFDNRISIIDGGTASLTDLGYGGNASATYGIEYQYQTTVYISYQLISFRSASITAATSYIAGIHSTGGTTVNTGMIYNNTISGLTANDNVPVSGICLEANSDCSIFNNTIQGIVNQTTGSNLVCGIKVNYGSCKIYNNMISQLSAPAIPARAVSGIELSSGTSNPMVYYNTVYLDYASTNASNQSAALYTAHTGTLDLRNNIFINKSVMTTGTRAVAFYASAAGAPGLTTASNNNLYYAGTPGTKNLIFYNGTAYQTLTDYQALWPSSPKREQLSVTENNTPFTSTSGTYNLHIPNGSSTLASAGGGVIIGYTTDIDGATRNATNPDIGADEFLTPQITVSPATLAFGPVNAGNTSASQPYTLNGADLSADVTITAPTKYMVSLDNSAFSTTLTVPVTNTNTGEKVVYVRFAPTSFGSFPGNVSNVSGSTTCNVAVSGTCVDPDCTQNAAATNLTFENITHNSIKVAGITAASGASGYVIYVNSANTFTAPVTGTNPGVNSTWANAGQQAIYVGNLPANANVTGLTALTTYYFKVYAYKSCNDVLSFESTGLSGSATTKGAPIYVRYNATGTANGTSWTNAYTSLQSALDAATASSQIWMAKGQYYPSKTSWGSTTPYDPRDKTFFLNKSVSIYGGFAGTETSTDQRSNYGNGGVNETILDGNISDPANATDNIYQIIKIPLSASPNLDGLSVKNSYSSYYNGGGIIFEGINYSGTNTSVVSNCYFSNNTAQLGSAVYVIVYTDNSKCLAQFRNCLFESNTGNGGVNGNGQGAIYLKTENSNNLVETSPVFTNCIIRGNTNSNGGGVCLVSQGGLLSPKFFNCLITGNLARFGGAILAWKISGTFSPNFVNSTLSANTDTYYTGGIYIIGTSTPLVLNNCVVWNNKTGSYIGTAAANIRGSGLTTTNSLVQGFNTGGTNLNGITNMGNSNYPGFTTPIDMSTAVLPITSGDFHLTDYAPVIDKGNTAYLNLPPTQFADLDGEERIQNGGLDLGAYEGGIPCISPVISVQPIAAAKFEGQTVIFTLGASGSNLAYQWKKNGTNISGATTASLTLTDLVLTDAGTYSCAVTGTCGSATSDGAMLTVDAACVNPAITSQPSGAAKKLYESVTFSVSATGTNLIFQWKKGGVNISGANSTSYSISNVAFSDAATYTCYISNACNSVTSSSAVLTVSKTDQTITLNTFGTAVYGDNDINPDATASSNLSVSFASSNASVATIVGNALHIVGVGTSTITASQAGNINYNAATSTTQLLTVGKGTATLTLGNLLQAHDGSAKSVTVTTDPSSLTTVGETYNSSSTLPSATGTYTVVATIANSLYQGTATGTLQITCNPVMAEPLQSSYYVTAGQSFSITATAVGSPSITYLWKKGGNDISGTNSATYTINTVSTEDVGIYTCYVSNGCGNITTNEVTLNVVLEAPTSATATPQSISSGESSNLTALSAGNQIRWYNAPMEGTLLGTVNSGVDFSVTPVSNTTYYAEAYNSGTQIGTSATRTPVTVYVIPPNSIVRSLEDEYNGSMATTNSSWQGQAFTTDNHVRNLESLDLSMMVGGGNAVVKLYSSKTDGSINDIITTFTGSYSGITSSGSTLWNFVPDSTVSLAANTTYWFVISSNFNAASSDWTGLDLTSDVSYTGVGAIPTTNASSLSEDAGATWTYYSLADGPFLFAVYGPLSSACTNPTTGGTIGYTQTVCTVNTPNPLSNIVSPTGQTGILEYKWQKSTTSNSAGFTDIANSNSLTYSPSSISQTTWYKRLARVNCQADWTGASESNVVEITVNTTTITSITPTSAVIGTTVTITGINFTNASAVSFGGIAASSFTVVSASSITAVVAEGATGGVSVTTPCETATIAGFTFIPAPSITSFSPTAAGSGTTVTITGSNFSGATAISFGGTAATSFTVVDANTITVEVGIGASGNILVTTVGGTATSTGFTFIPAPSITSFSPTAA